MANTRVRNAKDPVWLSESTRELEERHRRLSARLVAGDESVTGELGQLEATIDARRAGEHASERRAAAAAEHERLTAIEAAAAAAERARVDRVRRFDELAGTAPVRLSQLAAAVEALQGLLAETAAWGSACWSIAKEADSPVYPTVGFRDDPGAEVAGIVRGVLFPDGAGPARSLDDLEVLVTGRLGRLAGVVEHPPVPVEAPVPGPAAGSPAGEPFSDAATVPARPRVDWEDMVGRPAPEGLPAFGGEFSPQPVIVEGSR